MQSPPIRNQKLPFVSPGLLTIVVFYAAGICWADNLNLHSQFLLYSSLLLLFLILFIHKYKSGHYRTLSYSLLGLLFFLLGLQQAAMLLSTPNNPHHIYNLVDKRQTVSLDGILQEYPSVTNNLSGPETRLLMNVQTIHQPTIPNSKFPKSIKVSGMVLLTLKGLLPDTLKPGDRFLAKTIIYRVSSFSTPGSFNYKKHLASQSIHIKGWIKSPANIIKLQTIESSLLASRLTALKYIPERLRSHIADFLDKALTQPSRGLYKAVLIGDRSDVPAAVLENFTGAGCIHILAISGMHMGLLAFVAIGIFTWLLKRSVWLLLHTSVIKIAVSISLLPLLIYALIAGFNTPVQRALVMTIVFILAIIFDRPGNLLNHILLAALLILSWKPGAILTASFQLSFSAVIAIALLYPLFYEFLFQKVPGISTHSTKQDPSASPNPTSKIHNITMAFLKGVIAGVSLTAAAMLGTLPLLLFHFNRFSLVAPITNLIVEPLICFWSLIIGLAASLCIPLFPALAKLLFIIGSSGLIIAERICAFFASLSFASIWLPTPAPGEIIITYLLLISSVIALHLKGKQRLCSLVIALFFLCSLIAAPVVTSQTKQSSRSALVTFLDVGHGSSILLQLQGDKNILIDGGGAGSDRFNIGEQVIGPFLWNQKISRLDAVVVTHPHADHYNGLPFILTRFRPKELWINDLPGHDKEYQELLDLANQLGIETKITSDDKTLFWEGDTRLFCIHSGSGADYLKENFKQISLINPNDLSLVLRLEADNKSFLFTGDISAAMAEILVKDGKLLKADVLMAPHHGSSSSLSQDFIRAVAPEYIAISAGRNSLYNLPAKSFYTLQEKGIEVLSTVRDGTITFTIVNGKISVRRYQIN
jgi:competence protein ComEC